MLDTNTNSKNISNTKTISNKINDDVSYNKRQFWEYKRLFGGSSKTKKINKLSQNNNSTQTRKVFHLVNNKIATDRDLIKRLDDIYIPPAYKDVVVAKSANNKIQAIGTDTRGRRQYIYNPTFIKRRNDRKYDDILELAKKNNAIEADKHAMLQSLGRNPV